MVSDWLMLEPFTNHLCLIEDGLLFLEAIFPTLLAQTQFEEVLACYGSITIKTNVLFTLSTEQWMPGNSAQ